jgi:hypothetical protein
MEYLTILPKKAFLRANKALFEVTEVFWPRNSDSITRFMGMGVIVGSGLG